jgi:two-component system chemotaxis response regulator CheY
MKVLIVEDDFVSRKVMLDLLSKYGECDIASNGTEALEAFVIAMNGGAKYDLITLDIMMPEINGHEVLIKIRQIEDERALTSTCIIMTSDLHDAKNIMTAFKNRCDGYICKPISLDKIKEMLVNIGQIPQ